MSQAGEVSVETSPYKDLDAVSTCPLAPPPPKTVCSVEPSETKELEGEAESTAEPEPLEVKGEMKEEKKEKTRKIAVTFKVGGEVRLRKNLPSRSRTMCNRPPGRSVDLRRQSLCNLRKGETGELGSKSFQRALRRDSMHEIHPGWESIRKLSKVVG